MKFSGFKKIVIYYFTGTGNSRNVANWFKAVAIEKGIETKLISISNIDRLNLQKEHGDTLIIFISPIHGFNYPPVMIHFIMRLRKGKNNVVLMNTRAGMLLGKYITPGLTGIAFYLASVILILKGYSIKAMQAVDMPSNWISLHPGLNDNTIEYLHLENKERVEKFATKILSGKPSFKSIREILQDLVVTPIAILYYFFGRFFFAKSYYASKDCNNCGLCIKECPVNAIKLIGNRPFWTLNCESCMKCMSNCPKIAIETAHGSIVLLTFLFQNVLLGLFYLYFERLLFPIENFLVAMFFKTIVFFMLLIVWYRLIHFLLRFRIIERMVVYTSLTKYKFWGKRYKALK